MLSWLIEIIGIVRLFESVALPTMNKAAQKSIDITSAADLPSYLHLILH